MKHFKYARYLARHKWFVFVAGLRLHVPLFRLIIHDWSKFLPCEWIPYANFFYGPNSKPKDKEACQPKDWIVNNDVRNAFDKAWLHHQHLNAHHWRHWVLRQDNGSTKILEMPYEFALEMVADWAGAGRAITGQWDIIPWYEKNKEKIQLGSATRMIVERKLGLILV